MTLRHLRILSVLLTFAAAADTVGAGQADPTTSAATSQSDRAGSLAANSAQRTDAVKSGVPGIVSEEEIPAFLRRDMCDTGDS